MIRFDCGRVFFGYTVAIVFAAGAALAGEDGRVAGQPDEQKQKEKQAQQEERAKEDAKWAEKKDTKAIHELCAPSVAKISVQFGEHEGGGTGFMIRPGILLTPAHVAEAALPEDLKIYFPSAKAIAKTPFSARILYFDRKRDLAMLSVDAKVPALRLADKFQFESGRNITMIGCAGFGKDVVKIGVVMGTLTAKANILDMPYYQLGAATEPGYGGGPVFDDRGQVIGVVSLRRNDAEAVSYCIPWEDLKERLEEVEKQDRLELAKKARLTHSLHVLFLRARQSTRIYWFMSQIYTQFMSQAAQAGRPVEEGLKAARAMIDKRIEKFKPAMLTARYEAIGNKLVTDSNLPADVRDKFAELWKTYLEFKKLAENPDNDFQTYAKKNNALRSRFQAQENALSKLLGRELEEEKVKDE